jgi:hypothetical protein
LASLCWPLGRNIAALIQGERAASAGS